MDKNSIYYKQVQLLVRILPFVARETCFALKGGTAINLFLRNLPRFSVDIDLVYLPLEERNTALKQAGEALNRIARSVEKSLPDIRVIRPNQAPDALRLLVTQQMVQIKLELSPVLRGSVFPPEEREVSKRVEADFGYAAIQMMSFHDLYAGKMCAALDRQHPRDLFDIKLLLENEGIGDDLRQTFLVYLISHNRTMAELLNPNLKDIRTIYEGEFANMTEISVSIEELESVRKKLIAAVLQSLTAQEKRFLLSFKSGEPEWALLKMKGIENLPAVNWKLQNLEKMPKEKHLKALDALRQILYPT